jgi:tetratricopeptide (TPR) repeat protein
VIQPKPDRRGLWAAISVCVVAVVAIGAAVFMMQLAASQKQAYDDAISHANSLDHQVKYKESAAALQDYLDSKPPKKYRDQVYLSLGSAYLNAGNYSTAVEMFKKADAADAKYHLPALQGLATAYGRMGDKATAVGYYRQLISIAEKSGDTDAKMEVESYNNSIRALEAAK